MEKNLDKSKIAFEALINLMDRRDLDEVLNSDESNWKKLVHGAMLTYAMTIENLDKKGITKYDLRRINLEACWMKALYLAGYEHGTMKKTSLIINPQENNKAKDVLRRIQEMAAEEIRTGDGPQMSSCILQIEADARAALEE